MAVGIQQDGIPGAGQSRAHTHGGRVSGGEYNGMIYAIKLRNFCLQRLVLGEGAVGKTGACGAGAPASRGILGGFDAARVK